MREAAARLKQGIDVTHRHQIRSLYTALGNPQKPCHLTPSFDTTGDATGLVERPRGKSTCPCRRHRRPALTTLFATGGRRFEPRLATTSSEPSTHSPSVTSTLPPVQKRSQWRLDPWNLRRTLHSRLPSREYLISWAPPVIVGLWVVPVEVSSRHRCRLQPRSSPSSSKVRPNVPRNGNRTKRARKEATPHQDQRKKKRKKKTKKERKKETKKERGKKREKEANPVAAMRRQENPPKMRPKTRTRKRKKLRSRMLRRSSGGARRHWGNQGRTSPRTNRTEAT